MLQIPAVNPRAEQSLAAKEFKYLLEDMFCGMSKNVKHHLTYYAGITVVSPKGTCFIV